MAKATIRQGLSVKSAVVQSACRYKTVGDQVMALEEADSDGHRRARIGDKEWISLRTVTGKVLAVDSAEARIWTVRNPPPRAVLPSFGM